MLLLLLVSSSLWSFSSQESMIDHRDYLDEQGSDISVRHWDPAPNPEHTNPPERSSPKLLILLYHNLVYGRTGNIYNRDIYNFEHDLAFIKRNFTVIDFDQLPLRDATTDACIITFDDGDLSNYAIAFPLLKEFGLKAVFFLVPEYVGDIGYMSWDQIREMNEYRDEHGVKLFSFGSHGLTHRALGDLSYEEILHELTESKSIIEQELGTPVDTLALPFGSGAGEQKVITAARLAGYRVIRSSAPGYAALGTEQLMNLPALNVENYSSDILVNRVFGMLGRQ